MLADAIIHTVIWLLQLQAPGGAKINSYMQITVRMATASALAQMKALQAGLSGVNTSIATTGKTATAFNAHMAGMNLLKWGSQMQWVGRQMTQNFTLPLLAAGVMASKWALDNEKAFVRVSKVYGNADMAAATMRNELVALKGAFVALSGRFGIAQQDAINIAGDWAAAGASGVALARAVELTMKTMVLGELDAKKATEGLIAIQAQYGLSTAQLTATIEQLNMIENQTGISLAGLIDGFARASGVARSAGVSTLQLGAMLAALTPAAGSAAQAGNALKTIISRLLTPTKEAGQILNEMGIHVTDLAWRTSSADERLKILAGSFDKLSNAQKAQVSASIASRYQINKFDVLMGALNNKLSYYYQALRTAENATRNHMQAEKELQKVLDSSPQRLQIIWQLFKNSAADVGGKLVPTLLMLANSLRLVFSWFNNLDPSLRKFLLALALILAVMGPIIRYLAAVAQAIAIVKIAAANTAAVLAMLSRGFMSVLLLPFKPFVAAAVGAWGLVTRVWAAGYAGIIALSTNFVGKLRAVMTAAMTALTGPWGIAIAAIVLIFLAFYNDIKAVVNSVVKYFQTGIEGIGSSSSFLVKAFWNIVDGIKRAFFALPEGVQRALIAVVNIVRTAAMKVYEFLSYMNPFARHSPSLVDQVQAGVAAIAYAYASVVPNIAASLKSAYAAIKQFGIASRTLIDGVNLAELGDKRIDIAKYIPGAVVQFDILVSTLKRLKGQLTVIDSAMTTQKAVVDQWKASLDSANAALDKQENALRKLRDAASSIQDSLDAAKAALQSFADAPIAGEGAMADAIFENEMAQKRLRLEMMKMEDAVGPLDKLESKLNSLNGALELIRGERESLRQAGAGSDILKGYDDQIKALEDQKVAIDAAVAPLKDLQDQLEALAHQGEEMNLEESLRFDPLRRQVDQLVNSMKELPFDDILAGVTANKAKVTELQKAYDAASVAVQNQEAVVNSLRATRDAIQGTYDAEALKLQKIEDEYGKVRDAIGAVEEALNGVSQAASTMGDRLRQAAGGEITPGLQNFRDSAGGNFPDPGGMAGIGREGGLGDQSKMIEEFTKQMQDDLNKSLEGINPFNWIKVKWEAFKSWWKGTVVPWWQNLFGGISVDTSKFEWIGNTWEKLKGFMKSIGDVASSVGKLLKPELDRLLEVGKKLWNELKVELGPSLKELGAALKDAWVQSADFRAGFMAVAKVVLTIFGAALLFIIKTVLPALINGLHALISGIISIVKGIIQVVTGLIKFFTGVFTGDWKKAWQGIVDIFKGIWNIIVGLFKGTVGVIWGIVRGMVEGIIGFFKWLWDKLVGHSIIPDMIRDIITWFKSLPGKAMAAIFGLLKMMSDWARNIWNSAWNQMKAVWNVIWGWLKSIPGAALNAVQSLIGGLANIGKNAFNALYNAVTGLWNGPIMGFLRGIPGKAASVLGGIGNAVANAVKGAWNGAAKFLNANVIGNVNKVVGTFGIKIPNLPTFARGGIVPGMPSRKDNTLAAVRSGEGILIPEAVNKLGGSAGIKFLNDWGRGHKKVGQASGAGLGGLPAFADGGVVGWFRQVGSAVTDKVQGWLAKGAGWALDKLLAPVSSALRDIMPSGFMKDYAAGVVDKWRGAAKTWGSRQDAIGGPGASGPVSLGSAGGNNIAAILATARKFFPGAMVSSGYRPGDPGYHGRGMAADIVGGGQAGMATIAQGFMNMSNKLIELIHEPRWYVKNGQRVPASYYASVIGHGPGREHASHVHVAANANALGFDRGGPLGTGYSSVWNGTGKTEMVSTHKQMLDMARAMNAGGYAAHGMHATAMLLSRMDSRIARLEDRLEAKSSTGSTIVLTGDLSFPNITSGADAEEFVKNLEALARSK